MGVFGLVETRWDVGDFGGDGVGVNAQFGRQQFGACGELRTPTRGDGRFWGGRFPGLEARSTEAMGASRGTVSRGTADPYLR